MAINGNIDLSNYFVNISASKILKQFSKPKEHLNLSETPPMKAELLKVSVITFLLILIYLQMWLPKRKSKSGYTSYSDTLPYVQWIPFLRLPVLDSLIFWYKLSRDGSGVMENIAKKYGSKGVRLSTGFKPVVIVSNPNIVQKLLGSPNPGHANKPQFLSGHLYTRLMKNGLVTSQINVWSQHRKVLESAFKYKAFSTYFKFILDGANELAQATRDAISKGKSGTICNDQMKTLLEQHLLKVAIHVIMGTDTLNFPEKQRISFKASLQRGKGIVLDRFHRPEQFVPLVWWLHPNKKILEQEIDNIGKICHQIADSCRKNITEKRQLEKEKEIGMASEMNSQQYLDKLEERREEKEIGIKRFESLVERMIKSGLGNQEITDEVATFIIGGHETLKTSINMLIFHLAANQKHQDACRAEVDNLFDSRGDGQQSDLNLEDFSKLKYLEMCILESMRLTPTVPAFFRDLQEPLKIDDNYVIPAKQVVLVFAWVLHRNSEIYPNPEKYDPNRFLPENIKRRNPYSFLPFSMGMRNCIGWKIALVEMKVVMAVILRNFEIHTPDKLNDYKLLFYHTVEPEKPFNVTFKKRGVVIM